MWLYGALPLAAAQTQSAALGGSAITPQQGSVKADRSVPLTTSAITCSAGTAVANSTQPLVTNTTALDGQGLRMVSTPGNMGSTQTTDTRQLFTELITSDIGSVTVDYSRALTTSASTCSAGDLGVDNKPTQIALGPITTAQGDVTPSGFSVTVNLNAGEMEMVADVGSVGTAGVVVGEAITSALNSFATVENTPTDTLLGISSTMSIGTVTANQNVEDTYISSGSGAIEANPQQALTGTEITGLQGDVAATEDVTIELVGEEDTAVAGDVGFSNEFELTGEQFLGEQYYVGAPGYAELTGVEAVFSQSDMFDDENRDYPLTGIEIAVSIDTALGYDLLVPLANSLITSEQFLFETVAELEGQEIASAQGRFGRDRPNDAGSHGHGKGKKRKKVTVDGQTFDCDEDELRDLVRVVQEVATAKAKEEADALLAAAQADKSIAKVKLTVPKVTGSDELKDAITDIYTQAAIDAQVALEVSRNRQLDEEEAIVLLLVN